MQRSIAMFTKQIKVSADKDSPVRTINLNLDMDLTPEQIEDLALRSLVITWQAKVRKLGDAHLKTLDGKDVTVKASEILTKSAPVRKPMTPSEMIAAIKAMPEGPEKTALIEQLLG